MNKNLEQLTAIFDAQKHIFPCKHKGKNPLTANGCKDASNDPAVIEAWKLQFPNCNWGLATGSTRGVFILDVDIDHNAGKYGDISLDELEKTHSKLPETATVLTGGGGKHHYFKIPEEDLVMRILNSDYLRCFMNTLTCLGIIHLHCQNKSKKEKLRQLNQVEIP